MYCGDLDVQMRPHLNQPTVSVKKPTTVSVLSPWWDSLSYTKPLSSRLSWFPGNTPGKWSMWDMNIWPSQLNSGQHTSSSAPCGFGWGWHTEPALHLNISLHPLLLLSTGAHLKGTLIKILHTKLNLILGNATCNTHYAAKVHTHHHSPRHGGMQSEEVCTPYIYPVPVGPLFCMTDGLITMEPRAQDPPWHGGDDFRNLSDHVFLVLSEFIHFQTYEGCSNYTYFFRLM